MKTFKSLILILIFTILLSGCALKKQTSQENISEEKTPQKNQEISTQIKAKFKNFKTDLSKNSIDFKKILPGGPGKDGIPALINPKFHSIKETGLKDDIQGIFVDINSDQRYYPYNILVWHEIVNDVVGNKPLAITFCPLCGSAIVFNRTVNGEVLQFAVSGFLYESNLLMYDTQSESFWSQVEGQAVLGSFTGKKLQHEKMQLISFGELKKLYPKSLVLSEDTGYQRNYGFYPYGDYETSDDLYFPVSIKDNKFPTKELMYVVVVKDTWVAFPVAKLKTAQKASIEVDKKQLNLEIKGEEIFASYNAESLPGYYEMWFSFATHHQNDGLIWNKN